MWSRYLNVTDGRTDGQTTYRGNTVLCAIFFLLGSVLLTERCRTDDMLPDLPVPCLPPRRVDSKVLGLNVIADRSQPGGSWTPTGLIQSDGGRSAAETTWWWSSSWAEWARCPKNFSREHFTVSETGKQPVMLRTVSFVVCLVYGIRKICVIVYKNLGKGVHLDILSGAPYSS